MNHLDTFYDESQGDIISFTRLYTRYISELLAGLDAAAIERFVTTMLSARENGQAIYFIGNGGSAATASHFANDIAIGTRTLNKPFRAISLTDNVAVMSAIANDDGYEEIFVQQLKVQMLPGDVVVGISASGNSQNVVNALVYAKGRGAKTFAILGFAGGRCREIADDHILIETPNSEFGPVEDLHMIIDHLVGTYLMRAVKSRG